MRNTLWALLSVVLLAACGIPDDEEPAAKETGKVDTSCTTHSECNAGLVCISASCQAAFPRTYYINAHAATISATREGGDAWDIDNSAPDATVGMALGSAECQTSVIEDSLSPQWDEACDFEVFQSSKIGVVLMDSDLDTNDTIGSWAVTADDVEYILKNGPTQVSNGQAKLTLSVSLK